MLQQQEGFLGGGWSSELELGMCVVAIWDNQSRTGEKPRASAARVIFTPTATASHAPKAILFWFFFSLSFFGWKENFAFYLWLTFSSAKRWRWEFKLIFNFGSAAAGKSGAPKCLCCFCIKFFFLGLFTCCSTNFIRHGETSVLSLELLQLPPGESLMSFLANWVARHQAPANSNRRRPSG